MKTDFYHVLQVDREASQEVIDAAYRALMKKHHPDLGKSGLYAKQINEANDILSDPIKREKYDMDFKKTAVSGKSLGPYRIIDLIAEGGFGRTYKAEHSLLKELVCIKDCSNVSPKDAHLLISEAKAAWDLRHYALPTMRDLMQLDDGRILLVMSYIPGLTLEQTVQKKGKLDFEGVAWITERILNALMYIHRHGVVHGDLKPQNVIVEEEKHMAVLVDFGLSDVKPTSTSESKGYTPYFAPPEEISGKPLIPESDYYSLGMTMIYAFSGGYDYVQRKQVPVEVPDEICNFIKRLIAKDVNSRPKYPDEDLVDTFVEIRKRVFGRARSGMKPLRGVSV